MYPTLSFALNDLFGINLPLPIQMFGFWVAVAFMLGAFILKKEFQRFEKEGLLLPVQQRIQKGLPPQIKSILIAAAVGFALGYKFLDAALNYSSFVDNPQSFLLSLKGSFFGGSVGAALNGYFNYREQKKEQLPKPKWENVVSPPHEFTGNVIVLAAVFGLLGAKVFHNLEYWEDLVNDPINALLSFSGLTFYGGLLVAGLSIWWYTNRLGFRTIHILDAAAPTMALTYGVGRIGCQMAGDGDWGLTAKWEKLPSFLPEWFWQYRYPHNVLSEGVPIEGCTGQYCSQLAEAVYPTPLWEAIAGIAVFFFLWSIRKRLPVAGTTTGIYLIVMGFERFFIEKIRHNATYSIFSAEITQAEIISTVSVLIGIGLIVYVYKNKHKFGIETLKVATAKIAESKV